MIITTDFETIFPIWHYDLWPSRISEITATSAMCYLGGYNIDNINKPAVFFAYMIDKKIAGVNSVHLCADGGFRSRGLFVYPEFRNRNIGTQLLIAAVDYTKSKSGIYIWSYPKQTSWKTYQKAGFKLSSAWETSELGLNAYCIIEL